MPKPLARHVTPSLYLSRFEADDTNRYRNGVEILVNGFLTRVANPPPCTASGDGKGPGVGNDQPSFDSMVNQMSRNQSITPPPPPARRKGHYVHSYKASNGRKQHWFRIPSLSGNDKTKNKRFDSGIIEDIARVVGGGDDTCDGGKGDGSSALNEGGKGDGGSSALNEGVCFLTGALLKISPEAVVGGLFQSKAGMKAFTNMLNSQQWVIEDDREEGEGDEGEGQEVTGGAASTTVSAASTTVGAAPTNVPANPTSIPAANRTTNNAPLKARKIKMPKGWKLEVAKDRTKRKRKRDESSKTGEGNLESLETNQNHNISR
jgi:hypothetical protein